MVFETLPTPKNIHDIESKTLRHLPDASMCEEPARLQIVDLRLLLRV